MLRRPRLFRRFRALVRSDPAGVGAGFVALVVGSATGLVAGLTLGSITDTLEEFPGLLVMVPALVGMRGNVYGALGSRLGTAIHTGTFRLSMRRETVVGQNLAAATALSVSASLFLALIAKGVAVAFGLSPTISIPDFVVIAVVGGLVPSLVVTLITVGVAAASVRRSWDLDNVSATLVTAAGDAVTLPVLFLATYLAGIRWVTPVLAAACALLALGVLVLALRSRLGTLRRIVQESVPVLLLAGVIDATAGLLFEKRLNSFFVFPVLLVLVPPFLSLAGSLGSVLSARVATKLHLGLVDPSRFSLRPVGEDVLLVSAYAVPIFAILGVGAAGVGHLAGLASPGIVELLEVVGLAALVAVAFTVLLAYFSAVAAFRLGLDPDNHSIPIVTASLDLLGAFALILAVVILGLT
jgi:mgtE-like transporter